MHEAGMTQPEAAMTPKDREHRIDTGSPEERGVQVCPNIVFVHTSEDAVMSVPHGELEWICRYGNLIPLRLSVASCLESYSYLLSGEISQKEAFRRLRLLRKAKKRLAARRTK